MSKPSAVVFKKDGPAGRSPTENTLAYLRSEGYRTGIVERRNPAYKHVTYDLFGIIDIIAIHPQRGVLGVQSTGSDFSGHYRKLTVEKARHTVRWITTPGASLMLIGWRRVKAKRGSEKMLWQPRIKMITTVDVVQAVREAGWPEDEIEKLFR